jgi:hypothetical protein
MGDPVRIKPLVIPQKFARPREAGWLDACTADPKLALRMTQPLAVILSASFGSPADLWVITGKPISKKLVMSLPGCESILVKFRHLKENNYASTNEQPGNDPS